VSPDRPTSRPSEAKLATPSVAAVVVRPETLARFRHAVLGRLTLVCAPAGYGKTTVTAAAVEALSLTATWYKLDILDHDPATFLSGVTHALRRQVPALGEALLERLRTTTEVPFPVEEIAAALAAECEEHVAADTYLILDDLHEAAGSAGVRRALDYLLANMPEQIRFVVLSRYEPAVSAARMKVGGTAESLGVDDLRFDARQAGAVLDRGRRRSTPAEQLEHLVRLTEGWPASIVLAGQAIEWLDLGSLEAALNDPRLRVDVYSYLAEQVYLREPELSRRFLLRTCCLDTLTAELADPLVGIDNSGRYLDHLAANRVFTFVDARDGAYRYHNLFRDFLAHRFVQDEGIVAFRRLQSQTAAVLEEAGQIERAIELLLSANEPVDALAAIARGGETLLERCETDRLSSWLDRLQPGPAAGHPWARLTASQLFARAGDYDRALVEIERAIDTFRSDLDEWGAYHALSLKESTLYWKGNPEEAAAVCAEALASAPGEPQRVHTLLSLASSMLNMRRWDEADAALVAAQDLSAHASGAEMARAQGLHGYRQYFTGHFREAREALVPGPWQEKGLHSSAFPVSVANGLGLTELELGNYAEASAVLGGALDSATRSGHQAAVDMVLSSVGLLKGARGETEAGLADARAAMRGRTFASDPVHAALALSHEATILRRAGDLEPALERHRESAGRVGRERDPYTALNCQANALFTECLLESATPAALGEVARLARERDLLFVALKAELYAAIIADASGEQAQALRLLSACMPRQLALGHRHILSQELCLRPELAVMSLTDVVASGDGQALMDALARHWRFADTVEAIAGQAPQLAPLAVQAATRRSADGVLGLVLRAVRGLHSGRLADAVEAAYRERTPAPLDLHPSLSELTARENEILALMAEGKRNTDMASQLFISLPTVKTHVNHIYTKLGVSSRVQAVLIYKNSTSS